MKILSTDLFLTIDVQNNFCPGGALAGLATDYCVGFSALDARQPGLDVVVIEDACRAINMGGSLEAIYEQFEAQGVVLKKADDIIN